MALALKRIAPEAAGVASADLLSFVKSLDDVGFFTHSLLIARGNDVVYEAYYKPFEAATLHRQYSVSKSFVSAAVGVAVTEGLLCLDDVIIDYFPEFLNENTNDGLYTRCRVRDMLQMKSNITTNVAWWGKFKTRVEAYYTQKSAKAPGSYFTYDSIGSFLLGVIIERLTGQDFLTYLKEKVLLELGFSKESYVLKEPGGHGVGDSGVMCTTRDLLILARLFACEGNVGGKQYIDARFMRDAISPMTHNDVYAGVGPLKNSGYGYLTWITPVGFALVGAGDQLALYDKHRDVTLVINADDQGAGAAPELIYHSFATLLLPLFDKKSGEVDPVAQAALTAYEGSRALRVQRGSVESPLKSTVNGASFESVFGNALGIERFSVCFEGEGGRLDFVRDGKPLGFEFGLGFHKKTKFSFGERARADRMGVWEVGAYDAMASAAFVDENTLMILLQVTDTYAGKLHVTLAFGEGEASMHVTGTGQYVFAKMSADVLGKRSKI
ncbi:MAG: serine hydrolase [Clostridia bacterium]|nr:serine hydrolase [Clostridia bacterium]